MYNKSLLETLMIDDFNRLQEELSLEELRRASVQNEGKILSKNAWRALAKENGISLSALHCQKLKPVVFSRKRSEDGKRHKVVTEQPVVVHRELMFRDGVSFEDSKVAITYAMDDYVLDGVRYRPLRFSSSRSVSSRISSVDSEKFLAYSNCISRCEKMTEMCDVCKKKYAMRTADKYRMALYQFSIDYPKSGTYLLTFTLSDQFADGYRSPDGEWLTDVKLLLKRFDKTVLQPFKKWLKDIGIESIYMFCVERGEQNGRIHFHACITLSSPVFGYRYRYAVSPVLYDFIDDEQVLPTAKEFYAKNISHWRKPWDSREFDGVTPKVSRTKKAQLRSLSFDVNLQTFTNRVIGSRKNSWTDEEWCIGYCLYKYWRCGVIDVQTACDKFSASAYVVKYVLKDSLEYGDVPSVGFSYGILARVFEVNETRLASADHIEDLAIPTGYYKGNPTFCFVIPQYYREKYLNYVYRKSQTDGKLLDYGTYR